MRVFQLLSFPIIWSHVIVLKHNHWCECKSNVWMNVFNINRHLVTFVPSVTIRRSLLQLNSRDLTSIVFFFVSPWQNSCDIKPIRQVLDVSLIGLYSLFFNDFLVRRPVKRRSHWGAVSWSVYLAKRVKTANYFSANQNWHPIITALVSSKMNTTGTKTFTSEWVLVGRLIIPMWDVLTVCCSPAFVIPRRLISGNIDSLAPGE